MQSEVRVEAPPAGAPFKLWVHLFNTGSIAQVGEDFVLVSDANDVADVREAIIRKFPDTAGGEANKLVVRPTRDGEPLTALRTKLSAVEFHCEADGSLHVFVDVPPKPEGAVGVITRLGWEIIDSLPDALPMTVTFVGGAPAQRYPNDKFTSKIDIVPWLDFLTEAKNWNPRPFLSQPIQLPLWTNVEPTMSDEDDVARAVSHVLRIVSRMSGTVLMGQVTTSAKRKRDEDGTDEVRRTRPDFTFSKDENAIAVVEIKKPLFGGGNSLERLAKAYAPNSKFVLPDAKLSTSAFATLQQLNTYFENSKVTIGVISDYDHFWFVRKVHINQSDSDDEGDERNQQVILEVSEALPCRNNAPTVLRALGYMVSLAIQEYQARPRTPSDATAAFAEEKHLETDSKQTPSSKPNPKKKGSEGGGKKGGPPAPMHSLGFGRCGRVLISPSPAGPVAVKFVRKRSSLLEELQHEAQIYQALVPLQGSVLPKLYHAGPVFDGKYFGLCLEPVGITVSRALALGVNREFLKKAALDALDKLHAAKFTHGDIRDRNICYEPQTKRVRLIDLGFAAPLTDEHEAKEERGKMRSLFDDRVY